MSKKKSLSTFLTGNKDNAIFLGMILLIGFIARLLLFPIISNDYNVFLLPWYETIKSNGGFRAVGMDIGDYMPTYYYVLAVLSYLPIEPIDGIKLVSCIFDVLLAFYAGLIVYKITDSKAKFAIAFAAVFFLPTVILNSAAWAQCDTIFTTFLLMSIYYLICGKDNKAIIFYAISFVFKIQAIFLAPFLLVLLLKGKIRFRSLLMFPIVYVISIIPAVIAGGNIFRLLTVYIRQSAQYSSLNMGIPNAWSLVAGVKSMPLGHAGIFLAGGAVLIAMYFIYIRKFELTPDIIVVGSALFALIVPFVLPYMHERYYYFADVMCLILVVIRPKKIWIFLALQFCSLQAICSYLFAKESLDMTLLAVIVTAALAGIIQLFFELTRNDKEKKPQKDLLLQK